MDADQPGDFRFTLELAVYRLSAIKKAAYRYAGDFEVSIEASAENTVSVRLRPSKPAREPRFDPQSFLREVLDQDLREQVALETKGIRDLLLAHTFSSLSLTDPQGERGDYASDPLNIRQAPHQ